MDAMNKRKPHFISDSCHSDHSPFFQPCKLYEFISRALATCSIMQLTIYVALRSLIRKLLCLFFSLCGPRPSRESFGVVAPWTD
jgi:hypothetical protein